MKSVSFFSGVFSILVIAIFCSCSEEASKKQMPMTDGPELHKDWYNVAFLVMDGVYNTEWTAAFDIFHHTRFRKGIRPMNVFSVANTRKLVTTFEGLKIKPDFNYLEDSLPAIDILVVPSAEHHMDSDLEDTAMINFVKKVSENCLFVTSHCDGAFVLAKAGVLNGRMCTTFPSDIAALRTMFPDVQVLDSVMIVHDEKYITSAGGIKTFDAALYLCHLLYGYDITKELGRGLVFDWDTATIKLYKLD